MNVKIGLADDNPKLLQSLTKGLKKYEHIHLEFLAINGQEVLDNLEKKNIDVMLMDINMPVMNGIEATQKLKDKFPDIKVIMLTVFDENDKIFDSILAGASGYLLKDVKTIQIIEAIEDVLEGGAPMSPEIATRILGLLRGKTSGELQKQRADKFGLTEREIEILQEIASGAHYNQIAEKLFISPKTVRKHIENIYAKLHVHNKVEAIQLAMKHKII
ncbi:two component transcriptional regulator, LuxR family [Ekhidna lutea]|uniref:Two component transcriptional regulator, LuxR family n=1 Tax=Ekhidna lutea TaxID=447679 RepID=A0A239J520_EKHLU|nr:response regulator transcription factor [Ekhidna lutea]SNT00905.1 two component transcriptional regulator, LuxR family [Ekhidna lutea]